VILTDYTDDLLARQCLELRNRLRAAFEQAKAIVALWDLPASAPEESRRD